MARSLREWVYLPARPEYAAPWLMGPALFIVLGALGFSSKYIDTVALAPRPVSTSVLFLVLGTALNFILLLTYTRSVYVDWKTACRPTIGTLSLLTVGYGSLWGTVLVLNGGLECAVCSGSPIDIPATVHVSATAVQILASVLLVAAFWKTEDLNLGKLQRLRDTARSLLPKVVRGRSSPEELAWLINVLSQFSGAAREIGTVTPREQEIIQDWTEAASELEKDLSGFGPQDFPELLPSRVAGNVARLALP